MTIPAYGHDARVAAVRNQGAAILRWLSVAALCGLVASLLGCPPPTADSQPAEGGAPAPAPSSLPIRLVVVDDAPLAAAIRRAWLSRAEGDLEIQERSVEELLDPRRRRLEADAVIYPSGLLGELVERQFLAPLPEEVVNGPQFNRRDIFPHLRHAEIVWGESVWAVPLGSPPLLLVYRADIFERLGLSPPEDWAQYASACGKLRDPAAWGGPADGDPAAWTAGCEPLGPGWAGQLLLARAAGYARHQSYFATLFDLETMEPRIATAPFVRALEELVACRGELPAELQELTPGEARRRLESGRCAMAITWPTAAADAQERREADRPGVVLRCAELPGSAEVYHPENEQWERRADADTRRVTLLGFAGRLGSLVLGARNPAAAQALLLRLSTEWSEEVTPASPGTSLCRFSQLPGAKSWTGAGFDAAAAREFGEVVTAAFERPQWLDSVRLPGRREYLAALDAAVHRALAGEATPAECLGQAAIQWREITERYGRDAQQAASWRSAGFER